MKSEVYTYIPAVPFISLYFFNVDRKKIFGDLKWNWKAGLVPVALGAALSLNGKAHNGP